MSSGTLAMRPLQTIKACVLSLAVMPVVGTSFALDFDISRWIVLISAAAMLLTIGIYVAAQTFRSRRDYHLPPPQPSVGDRVSNRLVVLSSAAVLAVYSVGYLRTRAAADRLAARVTRQAAETAARGVVPAPPPAPRQSSEAPQTDPRTRKNATGRSSRASSASERRRSVFGAHRFKVRNRHCGAGPAACVERLRIERRSKLSQCRGV